MIQQTYDFDTAVRLLGDDGGMLCYRSEPYYNVDVLAAALWRNYPYASQAYFDAFSRGEFPTHQTRAEYLAQVRTTFTPDELAGPWVIDNRYTPLVIERPASAPDAD